MKKTYMLMLSITMTIALNATNYFVDTTKAASGDGTSWESAYKTLLEAETAANGNAGVDNIYIKGGTTITGTSGWTLKAENYYFSCDISNTGTSTVRTPNDTDVNGITEPWEFLNPTVFSSTYAGTTGTAVTLVASTTLDGLTITHTVSRTNGSGSTCINPVGGVIQNCVFTGSTLSYPGMTTNNPGGCLIRTLGTLTNSLFEKNTVSITNTSTLDLKAFPFLDVNLPGTSTTVSISGCVLRNNRATIDYSSATATTFNNLRGMVLNISNAGTSNTAGTKSTVTISDCLVYNNDITFTGNATITTAPNACIATHIIYSGSNTTNNWINNTFANNKSTNLKNACMALYVGGNTPDFAIHNVYNNVFWNNQNTISATSVTSNVGISSGSAQNIGTVLSNNIQDVVLAGNWGTNLTNTANLTNLSKTNTTISTGPQFKRVSSAIGYIADGSVELADWRVNNGSYLIAKGVATSITTDKAGVNFAATPTVGAYEYVADISTVLNPKLNNQMIFRSIPGGIISNVATQVQLYNLSGRKLQMKQVAKGELIKLTSGVYILEGVTELGTFVQKVVL